EGFNVHGVDASPSMITAFRARFPHAPAEQGAVEDSQFFGRSFDGVIASHTYAREISATNARSV
ncbi:MAG TPA: class I SAM-dependent methyltransferase, partial [Blastocatellia bacterium]